MEPEDTRSQDTVVQRIVNGIAVARLFKKQGDLLPKLLIFAVQLFFMFSLTLYAAANSATVGGLSTGQPQGGIMFLYGLAIAAGWVILLIVLQVVDDRNVVVAGKFPLMVVLLLLFVVIFLGVIIGGIVATGDALIGAGAAVGYFILTWFLTEVVQACAVLVQYQMTPRRNGIGLGPDDEEDEYADARGTFQGVDASIAVSPGATSEVDKNDDDEFAGLTDDSAAAGDAGDDDLGLL